MTQQLPDQPAPPGTVLGLLRGVDLALAMTPRPPAFTDEWARTHPARRVLAFDWLRGTITLDSVNNLDCLATTWFPIPLIPDRNLQARLTSLTRDADTLLDALVHHRDTGEPLTRLRTAVDALTLTWCGRPTPLGELGECVDCGQRIENSAHTGYRWVPTVGDEPVPPGYHDTMPARKIRCPRSRDGAHEPGFGIVLGHGVADYRPFHDLLLTRAAMDLCTAVCCCTGWQQRDPARFLTVWAEFERHANTPLI